ncbi:lipase 3-like isoform X2 [Chelonus insularis]|uniref:lipase 3-like isoform X2 n=1 Tax=Chelonus insularis TaxID=460826 RepID=UPI001589D89E|nr:lipase 3-like isoform X2 [Chelonus insularis]
MVLVIKVFVFLIIIIFSVGSISTWDRFESYFDISDNTTLNILPEYKIERYIFPDVLPNSESAVKNEKENDATILYRISCGPKSFQCNGKRPALIQHGFLCNSESCFANKPLIAVVYLLVDQGYDIWLGLSNSSVIEHSISDETMEKEKLAKIAQYILASTDQPELLVMGYYNDSIQFFGISAHKSEKSKFSEWLEKIPGVKSIKKWSINIYNKGKSYFTRKKLDFVIDNKPIHDLKEKVLKSWGIIQSMVMPTLTIDDFSKMINHPDVYLDVPQLITKYGYKVETHEVKTIDGYLLSMHRITGKINESSKLQKPVVFLQHGILASSAIWILTGPQKGLGYILADEGYDVWMGNSRGNIYSQAHENLTTMDSKFWDFSWHEMGVYDLPASIDYILSVTEHKKLYYLAHSQGTTSFFVMMSEKPEYNDKVIKFAAYAPIVYVSHVQSPIVDFFAKISRPIYRTFELLKIHDFLPTNALLTRIGRNTCEARSLYQVICSNALFMITGYDSAQINKTVVPVILGHLPAGSSIKQFFHYGQMMNSKKFQKFNYNDPKKNMEIYGQLEPPEYKLNNTKVPVAIFHGANDLLADSNDVAKLANELPNLKLNYKVPMEFFNHIDFMFAIDAPVLLYQPTISFFQQLNDTLTESTK